MRSLRIRHDVSSAVLRLAICLVACAGCQSIRTPGLPTETNNIVGHATVGGEILPTQDVPISQQGLTLAECVQTALGNSQGGSSIHAQQGMDQFLVRLQHGRSRLFVPLRIAMAQPARTITVSDGDRVEILRWRSTSLADLPVIGSSSTGAALSEEQKKLTERQKALGASADKIRRDLSTAEKALADAVSSSELSTVAIEKANAEVEKIKKTLALAQSQLDEIEKALDNRLVRQGINYSVLGLVTEPGDYTTDSLPLNNVVRLDSALPGKPVEAHDGKTLADVVVVKRLRSGMLEQFIVPYSSTVDGTDLPEEARRAYEDMRRAAINNGDVLTFTRIRQLPIVREGMIRHDNALFTQVQKSRQRILAAAREPSRWERLGDRITDQSGGLRRVQLPPLPFWR